MTYGKAFRQWYRGMLSKPDVWDYRWIRLLRVSTFAPPMHNITVFSVLWHFWKTFQDPLIQVSGFIDYGSRVHQWLHQGTLLMASGSILMAAGSIDSRLARGPCDISCSATFIWRHTCVRSQSPPPIAIAHWSRLRREEGMHVYRFCTILTRLWLILTDLANFVLIWSIWGLGVSPITMSTWRNGPNGLHCGLTRSGATSLTIL